MKKVYESLCLVAAELAKSGIAKNRKNKQGEGYMFRGIDDVYAALSQLLSANKLCILPRVIARTQTERTSKAGGALFCTALDVEFDIVSAEDGSTHTVRTAGEAMDSGDKGTNKAMSAAYKYMAFLTFAIPVEGEPDADASTHEVESEEDKAIMAWIEMIPRAENEAQLDVTKKSIIDDYKGESNVPKVLKNAIRARRAVLAEAARAN